MRRKLLTYASLLIIFVFIGYMVYDSARPEKPDVEISKPQETPGDKWEIRAGITVSEGILRAVSCSNDGRIFAGGTSFVACYEGDLKKPAWTLQTESAVTSLAYNEGFVFASTMDQILVVDMAGKLVEEWGPYTNTAIITSVSANKDMVAFADAGNKMIYVLDREGVVQKIAGQDGRQFVIPSAYFDVALNRDNSFFAANTGHRRIEKRNADGMTESWFGEPGLAPEAFCGCCNPAHFAIFNGGFVTAEKGINRIKILDENGDFVEFVSSDNDFTPATPLDVAVTEDGKTIYAADTAGAKIYVFERKN